MAKAAIYARISKDDERTGLGVDRQLGQCRKLAKQQGHTVVAEMVDDSISAYSGKRRPQWEAMLDAVRSGAVAVIVAYHNDRLTRSPRELEDLIDLIEVSKTKIITVAAGEFDLATATGRTTARIVGGIARGESERMSERLKAKFDQSAENGDAPGGRTPYGFTRVEKRYEQNPDEVKVLRRIAKAIDRGDSLLSISRALTEDGVATREGRPWHHSTVRAVMINPAIAGRRIHRREVVGMGSWKPIFDGDDFDRRASKIADPARKHKRASRKYLLRGIIRNEQGENLIGRDTATRPATYVTPQYAEGEWVGILSDRVEAVVIEAVLQRFEKTPKPKAKKVGSATGSAAADIEKELLDLAQLRAANKISLDEWIIVRDGIQARLAEAQKLAPIAAAPVYPATPAALRDAWPSLSFDQQRQVVVDSVESVVVCRSEKPRWTAVDDRITINWRVD